MSDAGSAANPEAYEVRYDAVHGWPVIYAPMRAQRPIAVSSDVRSRSDQVNPFLPGNEGLTLPERYADREAGTAADQPGWRVRIIPNKYPALIDPDQSDDTEPLDPAAAAVGYHDVIIETPRPIEKTTDLEVAELDAVFRAYWLRLREIAKEGKFAHATIFKNQGRAAGASQPHLHSQLMATRFVPPQIEREIRHATEWKQAEDRSFFAQLLEDEIASGERIVQQNEQFVLLCPRVSRFPFEMQILPKFEQPDFHRSTETQIVAAGRMILSGLTRLENVLGHVDFNYVLHTAPFECSPESGFRWHWEIYPRITGLAGWELGLGSYVNPIFPEFAAQGLRQAGQSY